MSTTASASQLAERTLERRRFLRHVDVQVAVDVPAAEQHELDLTPASWSVTVWDTVRVGTGGVIDLSSARYASAWARLPSRPDLVAVSGAVWMASLSRAISPGIAASASL
jgi:hypothetical protein